MSEWSNQDVRSQRGCLCGSAQGNRELAKCVSPPDGEVLDDMLNCLQTADFGGNRDQALHRKPSSPLRFRSTVESQTIQTSWYTYISPRDQTFVAAVRKTTLSCLDSIIRDLTETQEQRNDAKDRLEEFIFTTAPTIFERHIKAYRQAKDDSTMMQLGTAQLQAARQATKDFRHSDLPRLSEISTAVIAQRYHLYASHPGMKLVENLAGNTDGSAPMTPTQTDPVEIRRPPKLRGIDESLADALSSSITALPPPQDAGGDLSQPISARYGQEYSNLDPYGISSTQSYEPSPEYLSVLADHFLRKHLPQQDYASDAERTMITEVLGNAVLGNVLRKCSEPWFIWRTGLHLIQEDRSHEGTGPESALGSDLGLEKEAESSTASSISPNPGNPTTTSVTRYLAQLRRILSVVMATCLYIAAAITNKVLQALQTDLPPTAVKATEKRNAKYLFEPWIEASKAWTSAGSAYGTRELWTLSKMLYIASWETIDR